MKWLFIVPVGLWFIYMETRDSLDYWLPAVGYAAGHGYFWVQYAFLAVVAAGILCSAVAFSYRVLSHILD
jgi:hypothetical protein